MFFGQNLIFNYNNKAEKIVANNRVITNHDSKIIYSNRKPKKIAEKLIQNNYNISCDKSTTFHTSTGEATKTIFRTIKIKNYKKKDANTENELKKLIRLYKNRISAKKSRQKRKIYITALEKQVKNLEHDLSLYENMKNENQIEEFIDEVYKLYMNQLGKREKEIILLNNKKDKVFQIKKREFKTLQNQYGTEIFKKLIQNIIPIEFKVFANKYIKFADLCIFNSFGELIEKILENQLILDEVYNLRSGAIDITNSMPLKIFCFFEKLKEFIFKFQEIIYDLKIFDEFN